MGKRIKITELLDTKNFEKHKDELMGYFEKGGTWQELLGYDNHLMQAQYKKAYDLYHNADYKNASAAFSYLTTLNPYEYTYWMGLGMCKQSERLFEEAVVSYTAAEAVNPENPTPHLHLAQCFHALNVQDQAIEHLNQAISVAGNRSEYKEVRDIASAILNQLPKSL
jgi:type III secretion system low calcium response chaperone LcrH/SycD